MYGLPGLWHNPEDILGAKSATKTAGELSIFSALLSETFCIIGDGAIKLMRAGVVEAMDASRVRRDNIHVTVRDSGHVRRERVRVHRARVVGRSGRLAWRGGGAVSQRSRPQSSRR